MDNSNRDAPGEILNPTPATIPRYVRGKTLLEERFPPLQTETAMTTENDHILHSESEDEDLAKNDPAEAKPRAAKSSRKVFDPFLVKGGQGRDYADANGSSKWTVGLVIFALGAAGILLALNLLKVL